MKKLDYTEREFLAMTPRKFFLIFEEFQVVAGIKKQESGIDELP